MDSEKLEKRALGIGAIALRVREVGRDIAKIGREVPELADEDVRPIVRVFYDMVHALEGKRSRLIATLHPVEPTESVSTNVGDPTPKGKGK